ncbi:MAG: peptidase and in kexin sedolisin [Symbiobacteriaceae bacterium]|jgi:hypothetical protein|nr:peptidase and in kexin sedolisin [Symbiobacteriaceae bacterium]
MTMFDAYRGMVRQPGQMAPLRRFSPDVLASDSLVPVVLEFEQPPVAVYKRMNPHEDAERYEAHLAEAHQAFIRHLESLGLNVQLATSTVVMAGPTGTTTMTMPHDFTAVFNGIGVLMPGRMVTNVASQKGVRAVTLNRERVYLNLDKSVPFIGAPEIWGRSDTAGRPIQGEGVTVAVIDTGVV